MTEIVGTSITSRVASGDKFRVTWQWSLAAILPAFSFDTEGAARKIQEWLPSIGFTPVSAPSAQHGDEVVVYDVRTAATNGGKTVAQILSALESVPWTMRVARLEKLSLTASSSTLEQGQAEAIEEGNAAADPLGNTLSTVGETIAAAGKSVLLLAMLVAVAAAVYYSRQARG